MPPNPARPAKAGGPGPSRVSAAGPPLAQYKSISMYAPSVGDFIVSCGLFRTYYGFVDGISPGGTEVSIVWESMPMLLLLLTESEQDALRKTMSLSELAGSSSGRYAILKHDTQHNATVWYI